jgi:hypothetical protein
MTTDEIRDGFKFRGGALALDLPATLAGRMGGNAARPADDAGRPRPLAGRGGAGRRSAGPPPRSCRGPILREALYALALARAENRPLPDADRALLNAFAAARRSALAGRRRPPKIVRRVQGSAGRLAREGCRCWAAT